MLIQNQDICNSTDNHDGKIQNRMLCTGPTTDSGVCPSNRGAGLYCRKLLTGVLSFGLDCDEVMKQKPAVYTEVGSLTYFKPDSNNYENVFTLFNRFVRTPIGLKRD